MIKSTDPNAEYPNFFMVSQSIHQRIPEVAGGDAEFELSIVWQQYKVAEDGSFIMDPNSQQTYYDDSFYITAAADVGLGDFTHYTTLNAQVASIKKIIEQETGLTLEIV